MAALQVLAVIVLALALIISASLAMDRKRELDKARTALRRASANAMRLQGLCIDISDERADLSRTVTNMTASIETLNAEVLAAQAAEAKAGAQVHSLIQKQQRAAARKPRSAATS